MGTKLESVPDLSQGLDTHSFAAAFTVPAKLVAFLWQNASLSVSCLVNAKMLVPVTFCWWAAPPGWIVHVASQRCETFAQIHNARWLGRGASKALARCPDMRFGTGASLVLVLVLVVSQRPVLVSQVEDQGIGARIVVGIG